MPKPDLSNGIWASSGASIDPGAAKTVLGWLAEIPPHQTQNWWQERADEFIFHVNEEGIAEWDSNTDYPVDGWAKGSDGNVYVSLQTPNVNQDPVSEPTYWENLSSNLGAGSIPVGTTIAFNTETPPAGFLQEDGSEISRITYAALFSVIGTDFGNGDGSTTFNLPDKRGRFERGWDDGSGIDPDAGSRTDRGDGVTGDSVGTLQSGRGGIDQFETSLTSGGLLPPATIPLSDGAVSSYFETGDAVATTNVFLRARRASQVAPENISVMYCIKF